MADLTDFATAVGALIKGRAPKFRPAPTGFDPNTIRGEDRVTVHSNSNAVNMPPGASNENFSLVSRPIAANADMQEATAYLAGVTYFRTRYNDTFSGWVRTDGRGALSTASAAATYLSKTDAATLYQPKGTGAQSVPGSGMKRLPLALTLGQPNADAPLSGQHRIPLKFNAPITRWRLHCSLRQPKTGVPKGANVVVTGIKIGNHAGGGVLAGAPYNASGPFQVPADGSDWTSYWIRDYSIGGNVEKLLTFGYNATAAPWNLAGGSWSTSNPDTTTTLDPGGLTLGKSTPLDWWIEAETYAHTPAVGVFGDSLSCGVGATVPVFDSMLSHLCRRIGALPVHWAASGDAMASWLEEYAPFKRDRWDHLDRPDSVIWAMGNNDAFGRVFDLPTMKSTWEAMLPIVQEHMSPVIYGATITPRTSDTSAQEQVRRDYNAWLASRLDLDTPLGGYRDLFNFVAPVSTDDETLIPAFDADGIHLTTGGYAAQADAVTRPVTSPRVQYAV